MRSESEGRSLEELVERWLALHGPRLRDVRRRESQLRRWLAVLGPDAPPAELTLQDVEAACADLLRSGLEGATVNRHVAALRAVLNAAVRWRLLERSPLAGWRPEPEGNRRTRWLSRGEVARLLVACRSSRTAALEPLVVLLLTTAKRLGATLHLRWEDVDLQRRIGVFAATNTKARQVEIACLNEDAVGALRALPRRGEWVFTKRDGSRWRDPRPAFRVACRRAGLADVRGRFHCLRHTAATWMEQAGVPLTTIARVTGHRSRAALERYLHDSDAAAWRAVEALRLPTAHTAHAPPGTGCGPAAMRPRRVGVGDLGPWTERARGPSIAGRADEVVGPTGGRELDETQGLDEILLRRLFASLRDHEVDYAVFGAVALGLHGLARATVDIDLFLRPERDNVERLRAALREVFEDPEVEEITADDLCGPYPAIRYVPAEGFSIDLVTRLGEAFRYADIEVEERTFGETPVRVVSARSLWLMKRGTLREKDRIDAAALAERFGFGED